jgi:uncharacterized protein (DUF302 family)
MTTTAENIGFSVKLHTSFDSALEQVAEALKGQGFGVLTEIDVQATLKKKLDVDFQPYRILGACNPSLAYEALSIMPQVGLLLPCNVTVAQINDDEVKVSFLDPMLMMGVAGEPSLQSVAKIAKEKLLRAAATMEEV